jgi:hypothetical protein
MEAGTANDSEVPLVHAKTVSLTFGREHISLLFGSPVSEDQEEITICLSDQVILSPFTAKRFARTLDTSLREYESKFGEICQNDPPARPAPYPGAVSPEAAAEMAGLLFRVVAGLGGSGGYERSFKVSEGGLLDNRFLLGVGKATLGPQAEEKLIKACSLLGLPGEFSDLFRQHLGKANYVHFGFEQSGPAIVYKVYLEFLEYLHAALSSGNAVPGPSLLHLGFKWNVSAPRERSLTRYTWHPWIPAEEIRRNIEGMVNQEADRGVGQAAQDLISLALTRIPPRDILYLEVTEDGNPRRSFDINVYRAHLRLAEVYPLLSVLCRRQGVSYDVFHALYDRIKGKRFGHLAAGTSRYGKNFLTVYYGMEEMAPREVAVGRHAQRRLPDRYASPPRRKKIIDIERTDEKAAVLILSAHGATRRLAFERSFKFSRASLLPGRFLVSIKRDPAEADQDEKILNACTRIGMPHGYFEPFKAHLSEASHVLFGFEKTENDRVYKAYLEFNSRLAGALQQDPRPESVVIYNGFKWSVSDPSRGVTTEYRAFGPLSAREIAERVSASFAGLVNPAPLHIADDFLDLAGTRTHPGQLIYFEATEENNPRKSFDVNVYKAELEMCEAYPLLVAVVRHYGIDAVQFEEIYEGIKSSIVGHLSGGIDREGKDFLTVYFAEKGNSGRGTPQPASA